jgi:hypothetical protein
MCDASGNCVIVGESEACGDFATACAPCSGGGCAVADGSGRNCTCMGGYEQREGTCQVADDECDPNPCGANTECSDTPGVDNYECACVDGYEPTGGDPEGGCQDIDECADGTDDCGDLDCFNEEPGFSCGCPSPQQFVDGACRCDLEGTFVQVSTVIQSWPGVSGLIESNDGFTTYSWALRRHSVDGDGNLQVDTVLCGGTGPEICDLNYELAHTQYQPTDVFGEPGMPAPSFEVTPANYGDTPGSSYAEPMQAVVQGLVFPDGDALTGQWPCSRDCVGKDPDDKDLDGNSPTCECPDYSTSNDTDTITVPVTTHTIWFDSDGDGNSGGDVGVTTWAILNAEYAADTPHMRVGAPIDGVSPDPVVERGDTSPYTCTNPDTNQQENWEYGWFPAVVGSLFPQFWGVDKFYSATRVISALDGSLNASCQLEGAITGPVDVDGCGTPNNPPCGQLQADARIYGCKGKVVGGSYRDCTDAVVDFFDGQEQTNVVEGATFMIEPASVRTGISLDGTETPEELEQACQEVRHFYCPDGEYCGPIKF